MNKTTPEKHDHNTDGQKQHQKNMITIQMYKTTPEKHDHNIDGQDTSETCGQNNTSET
jgi:hypothetical protein